MAPSQHDWKIVDWDVKPQHNQPTYVLGENGHTPNIKYSFLAIWIPKSTWSVLIPEYVCFLPDSFRESFPPNLNIVSQESPDVRIFMSVSLNLEHWKFNWLSADD